MCTNANDNLGNFNGASGFYRHQLSKMRYSCGVYELAEHCSAYWFIDLIISYQTNQAISNQPFQVWQLKRVKDDKFKVTATDGNENNIAQQAIPYSDFPYDKATIWLIDGVLLLPAEY